VGSSHFRTSVAEGLEIIQGLRGYTTGYAVPTYVIDAPGGGGKIPLVPAAVVRRDGNALVLKNYAGHLYQYPDPGATHGGAVESAGMSPTATAEAAQLVTGLPPVERAPRECATLQKVPSCVRPA